MLFTDKFNARFELLTLLGITTILIHAAIIFY